MSTIVIFGGTGYAGGHIAREAVSRNHTVISYSRHQPTTPIDGVKYETGSVTDPDTVRAAASAADDLVVATHGADVSGDKLVVHVPSLIEASIDNDVRLSFVGGAGSSLIEPGGPRLIDTPAFPEPARPEAAAHAEVLAELEQAPAELRWFYVSPAATFGAWAPGEATGSYRTGGDVLVTAEDGTSEISGADLALAFVDEIEQGNHPRQRFTVGH